MKPQNEIKREAMSAVANVQKVAQIGLVKVTCGAAIYAAHIRQMDRQAPARQRQIRRDAVGREI
jgi:hypothetical protein